ncbi:ribose-5-phosphate isomerase [soil metagenome]
MKIYIGADHRGYQLKEFLKDKLTDYEVIDMGAFEHAPQDDFVDFAKLVGHKVATDREARGILTCGSGAGMCMAANKIAGIRSTVAHSAEEVKASRNDDDLNVLVLPADFISQEEAVAITQAFLTTEFAPEERFIRRIAKITNLEERDAESSSA